MKITNIKAKPVEEIKKLLHKCAVAYSQLCDKHILFIYREKSPDAKYHYYEVFFGSENFIHLAGCKSNSHVSAVEFYEECLECKDPKDIHAEHITYKESRAKASEKLEVLESLLTLKHTKIYRMGNHDKLNKYNHFEVGLGNNQATLGFTPTHGEPNPTTVLHNPLSEYCSNEGNVLAILTKSSEKYDTVIGCMASGLMISELPQALQNKIDFGESEKITKSV